SFFFQAEDGIRDGHVTGVQTCALPIFDVYPKGNTTPTATNPNNDVVYLEFHTFSPEDLVYVTKSTDGGASFGPSIPVETGTNSRSEERRVGKECRCGWWPEQ